MVLECYDCGKKFSALRRRRHCRICGQIFCTRCASTEIHLTKYNLGRGSLKACTFCAKEFRNCSSSLMPPQRVAVESQLRSSPASGTPSRRGSDYFLQPTPAATNREESPDNGVLINSDDETTISPSESVSLDAIRNIWLSMSRGDKPVELGVRAILFLIFFCSSILKPHRVIATVSGLTRAAVPVQSSSNG